MLKEWVSGGKEIISAKALNGMHVGRTKMYPQWNATLIHCFGSVDGQGKPVCDETLLQLLRTPVHRGVRKKAKEDLEQKEESEYAIALREVLKENEVLLGCPGEIIAHVADDNVGEDENKRILEERGREEEQDNSDAEGRERQEGEKDEDNDPDAEGGEQHGLCVNKRALLKAARVSWRAICTRIEELYAQSDAGHSNKRKYGAIKRGEKGDQKRVKKLSMKETIAAQEKEIENLKTELKDFTHKRELMKTALTSMRTQLRFVIDICGLIGTGRPTCSKKAAQARELLHMILCDNDIAIRAEKRAAIRRREPNGCTQARSGHALSITNDWYGAIDDWLRDLKCDGFLTLAPPVCEPEREEGNTGEEG